MIPWIAAAARHFSVIAFDTPGYGFSDPLPEQPSSLLDYVNLLREAVTALKVERFVLLGSATGAQIAVEWAKLDPCSIALLVLDAACHFEDRQREALLRNYFPTLQLRSDGTHLTRTWHICQRLFETFPWYSNIPKHRLRRPEPPPEVLHAVALSYLRAGRHYDWAYRLAMGNERVDRLRAVSVPTLILHWQHSLVHGFTEALLAHELPANFSVLKQSGPADERIAQCIAVISARPEAALSLLPLLEVPRISSQGFVDTPVGRVFWQADAESLRAQEAVQHAMGSPRRLRTHELGLSGACMQGTDIVFDLPGHGRSGPIPASVIESTTCGRELWNACAQSLAKHFDTFKPKLSSLNRDFFVGERQWPRPWRLTIRADGGHFQAAWQLAERMHWKEPWASSDRRPLKTLRLDATTKRAQALLESCQQLEYWLR
jgi:pimeloyl-ACP methyl ester carboxylesterase